MSSDHFLVGADNPQRHLEVAPAEAAAVQRIYELFVAGWSAKRIAHQLNLEGVPPPRSRSRAKGWTFATIAGCPKKAIGILHNPIYVGRIVWNRSQKVRDPDSGRRLTSFLPESEWIWAEAPELRIVSDDLWHQVQARRRARTGPSQARFQYLLSGMMVCGVCGSHYVAKTAGYYGCASNINRGTAICANGRLIRRDVIEPQILAVVREQLYDEETIAGLTDQVNVILRETDRERAGLLPGQTEQLRKAEDELENIKAAIRAGILTPSTRQMLEDAEATVARLRSQAAAPRATERLKALPATIRQMLDELPKLAAEHPAQARDVRSVMAPIVLRPTEDGLEAEVSGVVGVGAGFGGDGAGSGTFDPSGAGRGI